VIPDPGVIFAPIIWQAARRSHRLRTSVAKNGKGGAFCEETIWSRAATRKALEILAPGTSP
jgi:hypothetical protein